MYKKELHTKDITNAISEFWDLLTESQKSLLEESISLRHYKKNEIVYAEEEMPNYLYCVLEGKVKIYRDGVGGRSQIMRVIRPVEYFGYRAYFANERFVTCAAAFEASTICSFPMTAIETVVKQNNEVACFFIRRLAFDLGKADERTVNLTQKHIRGRLADNLLFLMDTYGLEADGATISIYLSREDLANLSNMTTANAIRTLSTFANEHIIALDGRKIKIIDEEKLRRVSKIG